MAYYISPRFQSKLAVHITKNYLQLPDVRIPLILGVHGRKGEGKTFQCELVYERMGVEVVHISGGELESPDAGDPARLIRLRYREAAELVRVRGVMAVLMINDIDAGAGRFDATTQYTVNTQLVNNTLMNIADNPTSVQLPGSYDDQPIQRVPIILTGNDLSTLYAPLIRDGRMQKFYWEPDRDDRIGIVGGVFAPDGLSPGDVTTLVDTFAGQAIDFFGALRAQIYDEQVGSFIGEVGLENVSRRVVNATTPPRFAKPNFRTEHLLEVGQRMVREQRQVEEMRLAQEYNRVLSAVQSNGPAPEREFSPAAPKPRQFPAAALPKETAQQVQQLLSRGYRVALEHADQRRFSANAWHSCAPVEASTPGEAAAALQQCIAHYPNEYVRLIGIDPASKRRILEQIVQRPG